MVGLHSDARRPINNRPQAASLPHQEIVGAGDEIKMLQYKKIAC
jgi:hypothetical protein